MLSISIEATVYDCRLGLHLASAETGCQPVRLFVNAEIAIFIRLPFTLEVNPGKGEREKR